MNRLFTKATTTVLSRMWRLPAAEITSRAHCSASSSSTTHTLYLHIGPGGDCWTGRSIFAAKHLQPDYVRSIVIPQGMDASILTCMLEQDHSLAQEIYDTHKFPTDLSERIQAYQKANQS